MTTTVRLNAILLAALGGLACLPGAAPAPAPDVAPEVQDVPPEVQLEELMVLPNFLVAMAIAPDGRIFYTERETGQIRIIKEGRLLEPSSLTLPVNAFSLERGLLGIALDPEFEQTQTLYVYYSRSASGRVVTQSDDEDDAKDYAGVRVSRLHVEGDRIVGPEEPVLAYDPEGAITSLWHYGGNIHFGPDGKLYVTRGDLATSEDAQDIALPRGKILRYNRDGTIPKDNPFGVASPVWALGLRNSFDFAFDPVSGLIFATENGTTQGDELNRIVPRGNYQWPRYEGDRVFDETASLGPGVSTPPLLVLAPEPPAVAPTGIAFAPDDRYGPGTKNDLFYGEISTKRVYRIELNATRDAVASRVLFADTSGFSAPWPNGPIDLAFGRDGVLYISSGLRLYRAVPPE